MKLGLLIPGIILVLLSFSGFAVFVYGVSLSSSTDHPERDNLYAFEAESSYDWWETFQYDTVDGEEMNLSEGKYKVWYLGNSPSYLYILDENGRNMTIDESETTNWEDDIKIHGKFEIEEEGTYRLYSSQSSYSDWDYVIEPNVIYITEDRDNQEVGMIFGGCCGGIFLGLAGLTLGILGLVLKKKRI